MPFNIHKSIIINKADQAPLLFYGKFANGGSNLVEANDNFGAAYANLSTSPDTQTSEFDGFSPINPSQSTVGAEIAKADLLKILGFGEFTAASVVKVIGSKGILPQKQVSTLTFAVSSPTAGQEITVEVTLVDAGFRGEFSSHLSDYQRIKRFSVLLTAATTAADVAEDLRKQIQSEVESGVYYPLTATAASEVLTLSSTDGRVSFSAKLSQDSAPSVTLTFATTTVGYPGRNTYEQLIGLRSEAGVYPYMESAVSDQYPIKGAKYSQYIITKTVTRDDLPGIGGGINDVPTGKFTFELLINESLTSYITDFTAWLNANVANRTMYTATTANAAAAAETPTVATTVDASAPYTTPMV
jgi:hypothetical protein